MYAIFKPVAILIFWGSYTVVLLVSKYEGIRVIVHTDTRTNARRVIGWTEGNRNSGLVDNCWKLSFMVVLKIIENK